MRAFVFTDRALEGQAGRFVWLSIDTERERNAGFLERYPIVAYPTLLVIDSGREQAVVRWTGGATVKQIHRLLDDGERAARGEVRGADAIVVKADRWMGRGRTARAVEAYRNALAGARPGWPGQDRAVESLLLALSLSGDESGCLEAAREWLPAERSPHFAAVAAAGLGCALTIEGPEGGSAVAEFEPAVRSAIEDERIDIAADDRSSLYGILVQARRRSDDEEGARKIAGEWLAFLEDQAARAETPGSRAVFDSHRLSAALEAGTPERAIPALDQSERDFPDDYNPPARLALAYLEAERHGEALAAADRALVRAYGPRKLRVYSLRADILARMGDAEGEKQTLRDALRYAERLPGTLVSRSRVEALERRLAAAP